MIGERLEEARKRKGVSIREVAETTKIRGEYLTWMEANTFEKIPLPQIYIRGFLKNYARYVKLDPNKILTDYDAHQLGRATHPPASQRSERESLGHVEIQTSGHDDRIVVTEAPDDEGPDPELRFNLDREAAHAPPPPPTLERAGTRHDLESFNENKALYMKIGLAFGGILVIAILLVVLVQLIRGKPDEARAGADLAAAATAARPAAVTPGQLSRDTIIITASDNVTLIVEQTADRKRLYSGTLNTGETLSLDKEGPVSIRFTNGAAIVIEKDGQQLRPGQSGVGRTVVD